MGHLGMNLTRNGLIVLVSVIFVAGAGTAYAGIVLPMITLAGNVQVDGDLNVDGKITANDFVYPSPQTRQISYSAVEFISDRDNGKRESASQVWLESTGTSIILKNPVHTIPDGATITKFECSVQDNSGTFNVSCFLNRCPNAFGFGCSAFSQLSTSGTPATITLSSGVLTEVVDREMNSYVITFQPSSVSCDSNCQLKSARITYQVPKVD